MILLYSGTPGSGKSLHATKVILDRLEKNKFSKNKFIICNYLLKVKRNNFYYMDNSDITPEFLVDFALSFHKLGLESQSLVVIDEASIFFNCRDNINAERKKWCDFFREHRKLGYDIILICQFDRMLDRQIRCFIEYDVAHRKLNNAGGFGLILNILHIPMFYKVQRWYMQRNMIIDKSFFLYSKKVAKAYDTFSLFSAGAKISKPPSEQKFAAQAVCNLASHLIALKENESADCPTRRGAVRGLSVWGILHNTLFFDIFKKFKKKK